MPILRHNIRVVTDKQAGAHAEVFAHPHGRWVSYDAHLQEVKELREALAAEMEKSAVARSGRGV